MNHIKQRLRTKPARQRSSHRLIRKRGVRIVNLHRLSPSSGRRSIRKKLCMAAFLQADEPEHSLFDGLADSQEAVVLQEGGFLVA